MQCVSWSRLPHCYLWPLPLRFSLWTLLSSTHLSNLTPYDLFSRATHYEHLFPPAPYDQYSHAAPYDPSPPQLPAKPSFQQFRASSARWEIAKVKQLATDFYDRNNTLMKGNFSNTAFCSGLPFFFFFIGHSQRRKMFMTIVCISFFRLCNDAIKRLNKQLFDFHLEAWLNNLQASYLLWVLEIIFYCNSCKLAMPLSMLIAQLGNTTVKNKN